MGGLWYSTGSFIINFPFASCMTIFCLIFIEMKIRCIDCENTNQQENTFPIILTELSKRNALSCQSSFKKHRNGWCIQKLVNFAAGKTTNRLSLCGWNSNSMKIFFLFAISDWKSKIEDYNEYTYKLNRREWRSNNFHKKFQLYKSETKNCLFLNKINN